MHDPALLQGVRVLLVDDNADQLDILGTALRSVGAVVETAQSAQEAFDSFQAQPPDVIVSDLAMPQATGYSLIRRIRVLRAGADVPAVAITAFHRDEHWEKAIAAGFNEWLPKPAHHLVVGVVAQLAGRG